MIQNDLERDRFFVIQHHWWITFVNVDRATFQKTASMEVKKCSKFIFGTLKYIFNKFTVLPI
jgi:hypothetical protein